MRVFLQTFNHCKGGKGLYTQHPDDDLLLAKVGCQSDKSPDDALFFLKNSLHQSVRSTLNESPQINNRIALHFQVATQKFDLCCPPFNVVKKIGDQIAFQNYMKNGLNKKSWSTTQTKFINKNSLAYFLCYNQLVLHGS